MISSIFVRNRSIKALLWMLVVAISFYAIEALSGDICNSCKQILINPVQTKCGHYYCETCLKALLYLGKTCVVGEQECSSPWIEGSNPPYMTDRAKKKEIEHALKKAPEKERSAYKLRIQQLIAYENEHPEIFVEARDRYLKTTTPANTEKLRADTSNDYELAQRLYLTELQQQDDEAKSLALAQKLQAGEDRADSMTTTHQTLTSGHLASGHLAAEHDRQSKISLTRGIPDRSRLLLDNEAKKAAQLRDTPVTHNEYTIEPIQPVLKTVPTGSSVRTGSIIPPTLSGDQRSPPASALASANIPSDILTGKNESPHDIRQPTGTMHDLSILGGMDFKDVLELLRVEDHPVFQDTLIKLLSMPVMLNLGIDEHHLITLTTSRTFGDLVFIAFANAQHALFPRHLRQDGIEGCITAAFNNLIKNQSPDAFPDDIEHNLTQHLVLSRQRRPRLIAVKKNTITTLLNTPNQLLLLYSVTGDKTRIKVVTVEKQDRGSQPARYSIKIMVPTQPVLEFSGTGLKGIARRASEFIFACELYYLTESCRIYTYNFKTPELAGATSHYGITYENASDVPDHCPDPMQYELIPASELRCHISKKKAANTTVMWIQKDHEDHCKAINAVIQSLAQSVEPIQDNPHRPAWIDKTSFTHAELVIAMRLEDVGGCGGFALSDLSVEPDDSYFHTLHENYKPALKQLSENIKSKNTTCKNQFHLAEMITRGERRFVCIYHVIDGKQVNLYIPYYGELLFTKNNFIVFWAILWQLLRVREYRDLILIENHPCLNKTP